MDAADPLRAASSATRLLRRTLGPAPAASPSKADEALLHGISGLLKGSKELVEQARMAMKEHGDIRMLYQDDGAQAAAAANGMNNQLRRRPAGDRKRHRFTVKPPASEPEPYVDRSILDNIADPCEYFKASDRFDDAEVEQKRLKGEPTKKTFNYEAPPRRRRGSVRSFNLSVDAHNANAIEIPASQTETMTESQLPQDDAHASVSEKDEHSVPSRSSECAVPDVSVKEDLVAEKDNGDALTYLLTSFRILDGSEEQDFVRKTLGIEEIRMEKVCHRDSVPADRPLRRDTARTNPARVHTPEGPLPGSHHARVSELEKRISFIVAAKDKCMDLSEDDGSEGSPDIVMGERSLMRDSSDVILMTDETFAARETDRETPSPCVKSAECVHDPEPNMTDHVTIEERQAGGSPLGLYRDTKVTKENDPCSRHDISMEEDDVPMDYSTKSNNEREISSHHLEGSSTEVLVSTPGRNMAPHDFARTSHAAEGNIQHQEVVEEDGIVQDKLIQSSEIPLEDIDPQIQSHVPDGNIKKLAADLRNALSPAKAKTQKAAQKGKKKQQSKRGEKMADESSHPLEIPQENFDSANQPHTHDVNIEQQTVGMSNALSPNKAKGQKESQRKNKTGKLNRRKSLADKSIHPSEIPLEDIDRQIQSKVPDGNIKKLAADLRNALSPAKVKTQKAAQKGKKKQQSKRGETRADESSHPLEIPQENFDSDIQPHTHDVNIEQQTVGTSNALSPNKAKGQKQAQRRSKTEKLNRRKSLADAGLAWQSGVRRSTRIRSRPLEHWRGERFVYGRIHDTMATVIGIKAYSPGQDGKRALKVKSFVPEEYSDLVAESAKY